jgi:hypothetical protein
MIEARLDADSFRFVLRVEESGIVMFEGKCPIPNHGGWQELFPAK